MDLAELENHASTMLTLFRVKHRKINLMRGISSQLIVDDFGVVVCCINRVDYAQVNDAVYEQFKDWRTVFITTNDNVMDKKYEVLWTLMRSGYMKWLRRTYPRQLRSILNGPDNLGRRIIEERLRIWATKPKYAYLAEDNKVAFRNGIIRELTDDPSFFDYMPEEK